MHRVLCHSVLGRSAVSKFRVERQHMNSTIVQGKQEVMTDGAELWLQLTDATSKNPNREPFALERHLMSLDRSVLKRLIPILSDVP